MKNLSDLDLINKFKVSGNQLYIAELYQRYARHIMVICMRFLKEENWYQDAAMEVYLKLIKEIQKADFESSKKFKNWLAMVVKNHCISRLRMIKSERKAFYRGTNVNFLKDFVETQDLKRFNNISSSELKWILKSLPEGQRRCIELLFFKGYKITDQVIQILKKHGVPNTMKKLKNIADFKTRGEEFFYDYINSIIGNNVNWEIKSQILKHAIISDKMSYKEISEHTGYSLKEVKSYIQTGKINLKNRLQKILYEKENEENSINQNKLKQRNMIARIWHGLVPESKSDDYLENHRKNVISACHSIEGNKGVYIFRRNEEGKTHILLLTLWDSIDSIRNFAGDEIEKARYYPEDRDYLLELEPFVVHYEIKEKKENSINQNKLKQKNMIARIWHGLVPESKSDDYLENHRKNVISACHSIEGNKGVYIFRRNEEGKTHILLLTLWDSIDSIRNFAGDEIEKARYYPEDRNYLLELEPFVAHYELADEQ